MRHVALFVFNFEATVKFYTDILKLVIEWQPDLDNVYLTSSNDNLALHRAPESLQPNVHQRLDHIGFILETSQAVDDWYLYMQQQGCILLNSPKTHRDGARSFYCSDPDGNRIQMIYHPPLSGRKD